MSKEPLEQLPLIPPDAEGMQTTLAEQAGSEKGRAPVAPQMEIPNAYRVIAVPKGPRPEVAWAQDLQFRLNLYASQGYACLHAFMPDTRTFIAVLLRVVTPNNGEGNAEAEEGAQPPTEVASGTEETGPVSDVQ